MNTPELDKLINAFRRIKRGVSGSIIDEMNYIASLNEAEIDNELKALHEKEENTTEETPQQSSEETK